MGRPKNHIRLGTDISIIVIIIIVIVIIIMIIIYVMIIISIIIIIACRDIPTIIIIIIDITIISIYLPIMEFVLFGRAWWMSYLTSSHDSDCKILIVAIVF